MCVLLRKSADIDFAIASKCVEEMAETLQKATIVMIEVIVYQTHTATAAPDIPGAAIGKISKTIVKRNEINTMAAL